MRTCHAGSRDHAGDRRCGPRSCSPELYGSIASGGLEAAVSANVRSSASYAFDYGSVLSRRIPARSASATDQFAVTAALISEADRSVTLAIPFHPLWRPGMHSTATSKITLCWSMRNLQAGPVRRGLEGIASVHIRRPLRLPGRFVSRPPSRIFRDRIQVTDQSDHASCQLGDPRGGGAVLGAEPGLHPQKLRLRQQSGERIVQLVLDEDYRPPQLAPRCCRRRFRGRFFPGCVLSPLRGGRPHRRLSHD